MASNAKNLSELLNTDTTVAVGDIADGSVTTAKLAADAVTAAKLADNAVVTANISDSAVTSGKVNPAGLNLGRRNLIINGAMTIAQRGTSDSSISDNEFVVDRYSLRTSNSGWYSAEQSTDAPSDFSNSLKITSLGANSPAAGAYIFFSQKIEGFNSAHLKFGTSSAKTVTLSFHVKSSLTGTFAGSLRNSAQNRSYPFTFTISSANTYEYKTITIAGDTSGTWVGSTNGIGLEVIFNLGSGTNNQGTAGAWASAGYLSASGVSVKNLVETNGATLFISGIQLEVGSVATDFEHRSFTEELMLCKRYFSKVGPYNTSDYPIGIVGYTYSNTTSALGHKISVPMRIDNPALSMPEGFMHIRMSDSSTTSSQISGFNLVKGAQSDSMLVDVTHPTRTTGTMCFLTNGSNDRTFRFDAEL